MHSLDGPGKVTKFISVMVRKKSGKKLKVWEIMKIFAENGRLSPLRPWSKIPLPLALPLPSLFRPSTSFRCRNPLINFPPLL